MRVKSLAIIGVAIALFASACSAKIPDIDVQQSYDLGAIAKGEVAQVQIPVRNLGDAPLTVEAIATSCGCTTATLSSMTIPPGGKALLQVQYDSNAHEADMGSIQRFVFISSNDPDESDMAIAVNILVQPQSP